MDRQRSFTSLSKEYMPRLRDRMSNSEDCVDLEKHFSFLAVDFINRALPESAVPAGPEDILFDPRSKRHFSVSNSLLDSDDFQDLWRNSDLPHLITKMADSAYGRYLHLHKHTAKTEKKIRN